jgi:hypothetical protein
LAANPSIAKATPDLDGQGWALALN